MPNNLRKAGFLAFVAAAIFSAQSQAAVTFSIVNQDNPGEGFNDPSAPLLPAPGNDTAATLGEQRLNAFQFAADLWAAKLDNVGAGDITVVVNATFAPSSCSQTSGNLGSAGPTGVAVGFASAPDPNIRYVRALAKALGAPIGGGADMSANFNGDIDRNPNCFGDGSTISTNWYYGLDGVPESGTIDFLTVVLHEIGHGIGFLTLVNGSTGALSGGQVDSFTLNLFDVDAGLAWKDMSNAQRLASITNTGGLVWTGSQAAGPGLSEFIGGVRDGRPRIYAPNPRESGSSTSHWDTAASPNTIMEPFETGDNRVVQTLGVEVCAMADIGWPLAPGVSCPDQIVRPSATVGNGTPASCTEAALQSAVGAGDGLLVKFDCGALPHTIALSSPISFTGGFNELDGGGKITLDGGGSTRVISNSSGDSRLVLREITIANGFNGSLGGGVNNSGTVSVIDSRFSGNTASAGGAIINASTGADLNIVRSLFSDNLANAGGATYNFGAQLTIVNSTFSGNSANQIGGALYEDSGSRDTQTIIRNSTFSGNNSPIGSIALEGGGSVQLINSLFSGNASGVVCDSDTPGSLFADGINLDTDGSCAALAGSGFITDANPGLDVLADNGGPTQTVALLDGSPAIDAADPDRCTYHPVGDVDQRGQSRAPALRCDIGAFELQPDAARMVQLPDINANGYRDSAIAFRSSAGDAVIRVIDGLDGSEIAERTFALDSQIVAMDTVPDQSGDGFDDIVVLTQTPTGLRSYIINSLSGSGLRSIGFNIGAATGMAVLNNVQGEAAILVAAFDASLGRYRASIKSAETGQFIGATRINFNPDFDLLDFEALNISGTPSMVLLVRNEATGALFAHIRSAVDGSLTDNIPFARTYSDVIDLEVSEDIDGAGTAALVTLQRHPGIDRVISQVRNAASGALIRNVVWQSGYDYFGLELFDFSIDGNATHDAAALRVRNGLYDAQLKDMSTNVSLPNRPVFGRLSVPQDFAVAGNANPGGDNFANALGLDSIQRIVMQSRTVPGNAVASPVETIVP